MKRSFFIVLLTATLLIATGVGALLLTSPTGNPLAAANLPDYNELHRFNPDRPGGHLLPNLNTLAVGSRKNRPIRFITNSQGFRNNIEFELTPPGGTYRVLLMGDSFIDGLRTDQSETIGALLENSLKKKLVSQEYTDIEVMISGHNNPANAWYYFQRHGKDYKPHAVLLGVTMGNDLTWHSFGSGVTLANDSSRIQMPLRIKERATQTGSEKPDLLLPSQAYLPKRTFELLITREFQLRKLLATKIDWMENIVPPATGPYPSITRRAYASDFFTSLGLFYQPTMPEIEKMFVDFETVLKGISSSAEQSGARFVAFFFPLRFQINSRDWLLLHRSLALDTQRFDLSFPDNRIKTFCENNEIECLMLRDAFSKHSDDGIYRPRGDMHLSERGQELSAEIIERYVLQNFIAKNTKGRS